MASLSMPVRFAATREPGRALSIARRWVCRPRIRPRRPLGTSSTSSPTDSVPSTSVPVTTVPNPIIVKARSIGRRGRSTSRRGGAAPRTISSDATSAAMPCRLVADTSTIGASFSGVAASAARTSARTRAAHSSSTRSRLVSATTPRSTPSSSRIARCSRVCGMTPSSAATTRMTASMPPTPASMFRMKS